MPTLKERLSKELRGWKERLPVSWRGFLRNVNLNFSGVLPDMKISEQEPIWPQEGQGPRGAHLFKAFRDLRPNQVRVVIFGNDPYTHLQQATGRSFEQGDLTSWWEDVRSRGRISPSLTSIVAAAAATSRRVARYSLVDTRMAYERDSEDAQPVWFSHVEFARAMADKKVSLPLPQEIFKCWASQGVLWINRTLTFSRWDEDHRRSHQALWAPFTQRVLELLVSQASEARRIVFALWGRSANELEGTIEALRKSKGVPASAVRYVKTGHPQWPEGFFRIGNPLEKINEIIQGRPIRWA